MIETGKNAPSRKVIARAGAAAVMVTLSSIGMVKAIAATATLPILAKLTRAVEITVNSSIDFGALAFTADQVGQARIDPATNLLVTDSKNSMFGIGGKPQAGRIIIKGSEFPVQISMEQTSVQLTNGIGFVTVADFNFINNQVGSRVTITPDLAGNLISLPIGATLNSRVGTMSGNYIGSNRIYANYQ